MTSLGSATLSLALQAGNFTYSKPRQRLGDRSPLYALSVKIY
jgi:hypothetical protein